MAGRYPWEFSSDEDGGGLQAWELDSGSDSSDDVDETDPIAYAAEQFMTAILDLYNENTITAEKVCVLCYWVGNGFPKSRIPKWGKAPNLDHYQRHLDPLLGITGDSTKNYQLPVVGNRRNDLARTKFDLPVRPIHESLKRELEEDSSVLAKLDEMVAGGELPPSYHDHPVVLATAEGEALPLPVVLYMDGFPYSGTDSCVGISIQNLVTQRRHPVALVRKKICCKCGCKGWCTFFPIMAWIRACFGYGAAGVLPTSRHDKTLWLENDKARSEMGGAVLLTRFCLLRDKGDWAEICERLGYPTWQSSLRPCFCCNASGREEMYSTRGLVDGNTEYELNVDREYEVACEDCEVFVLVTDENIGRIVRELAYIQESRGLALRNDIPGTPLLKGDRVEPTLALPDVADIGMLARPCRVLFWRRSEETLCLRRSPLMDSPGDTLGITPSRTICVDTLHAYYLGPVLVACMRVMWVMIRAGIWAPGIAQSDEAANNVYVALLLKQDLFAFYKEWKTTNPGQKLTEVSDITPKMIGTKNKPKLKTKAAESYGFLLFLRDRLARNGIQAKVGRNARGYLEILELLISSHDGMKAQPKVISEDAVAETPCDSLVASHFQ